MILKPKLITKIEPGHRFSKGLVGSWLFNEGGGDLAYDTSGNGNHGTLVGDTRWVAGKFGPVTIYDGTDDHIAIPNFVRPVNSFTLFAWINLTDVTNYRSIIGGDDSSQGNTERSFWLRVRKDSGKAQFLVFVGATAYEAEGTSNLSDGLWHSTIGTYDGNVARIYVDGIEQGSNSFVSGSLDGGTGIAIGTPSDEWTDNYGFKGIIDNAGVYNRALSPGEIKDLNRDPFQMFKRNL